MPDPEKPPYKKPTAAQKADFCNYVLYLISVRDTGGIDPARFACDVFQYQSESRAFFVRRYPQFKDSWVGHNMRSA